MLLWIVLVHLIFLAFSERSCSPVGTLDVDLPSFVRVFQSEKDGSTLLFVDSFKLLESHAKVFVVPDVQSHLDKTFSNLILHEFISDSDYKWTNELNHCSSERCGTQGILVNDGFFLPNKNDGNVYYVPINDPTYGATSVSYPLYPEKKGYFYHQTKLIDLDGDGTEEILSARSKVDMFTMKSEKSEMVVAKGIQKNDTKFYKPQILFTFPGPEMLFDAYRDESSKKTMIVSANFFAKHLALYSSENWMSRNYSTTILDSGGQAFSAHFVDILGTGDRQILSVIQHEDGDKGYVYGYENVDGTKWIRHEIAGPYSISGKGKGAPGDVAPIQFSDSLGRPSFLMSGDDSGGFYLINPKNKDGWDFETVPLLKTSGTVGMGEVFYTTDGKIFLVLADYKGNKVHLFSCQSS